MAWFGSDNDSSDNVSHEQITKTMDMLTAMTAAGAAEAEVFGKSGYGSGDPEQN